MHKNEVFIPLPVRYWFPLEREHLKVYPCILKFAARVLSVPLKFRNSLHADIYAYVLPSVVCRFLPVLRAKHTFVIYSGFIDFFALATYIFFCR